MTTHRWIGHDDDDECMVCGAVAVGGCSSEMPPCPGLNAAVGEVWVETADGAERQR